MTAAPVLVFGVGNPSRGDDRLGPDLLRHLTKRSQQKPWQADFLTDFQLQIEHILDLQNRELALFVDASVSCHPPFELNLVQPVSDFSFSTHAMTPACLLYVYRMHNKKPPPPAFLLAIKAEQFELGQPACASALNNLSRAEVFSEQLLDRPALADWLELAHNARNFAA